MYDKFFIVSCLGGLVGDSCEEIMVTYLGNIQVFPIFSGESHLSLTLIGGIGPKYHKQSLSCDGNVRALLMEMII